MEVTALDLLILIMAGIFLGAAAQQALAAMFTWIADLIIEGKDE